MFLYFIQIIIFFKHKLPNYLEQITKIIEIESEFQINSFRIFQLAVSEKEWVYQCLHTDFTQFSSKLILYVYKKVCSIKQFYFLLIKVFLKKWGKSVKNGMYGTIWQNVFKPSYIIFFFCCFFSYLLKLKENHLRGG